MDNMVISEEWTNAEVRCPNSVLTDQVRNNRKILMISILLLDVTVKSSDYSTLLSSLLNHSELMPSGQCESKWKNSFAEGEWVELFQKRTAPPITIL